MSHPLDPESRAAPESEELDERVRERLATLAAVPSPLTPAARERVIAAAVAAARRQRIVRRLVWSAATATSLAAGVALWLGTRPDATGRVAACEGWEPAADAVLAAGPQSIGVRGVVALEESSEAHFGARTACRTEIVLERGGVVVRADDLGGGEFLVLSGEHEVRVTGTLFAVRRAETALEVDVIEGHVRVDGDVHVGAGEHLVVGHERTALAVERAASMRRAIDGVVDPTAPSPEPPAPPEPLEAAPDLAPTAPGETEVPPSVETFDPDRLAMDAERAYRAGDLVEARASFRRAGARSEAALVRWARLELDAGHVGEARTALDLHARRYPHPSLGAEAQYLRIELADARHDDGAARAAATSLLDRYPDSPQARAARRRLER